MDQANRLRNIVKRNSVIQPLNARVITVTSGKGGVGKSNICVNLAVEFRKLGKRVVIFDADFGFANIEIIFGVLPKYNLFDTIYHNKTLAEVLTQGPLGIEFLSGGSGVNELLRLDETQVKFLVNLLIELDRYADIIIIDTGAGVSEMALQFIYFSQEIVLVTTPEPTAVTDAYSLLKAIKNNNTNQRESVMNVVVNRVVSDEEGVEVFNKLSKVAQRFLNVKINNLGFLPDDKMLSKSVIEQKPVSLLYPGARVSKAFEELGRNIIENQFYQAKTKRGISGMFSSFLNRKR